MFQVNLSYSLIDDNFDYWVSEYSEDGYRGRLNETVYQDGVDYTEWCLFVGTKEECNNYISEQKI